MKVQYRFWQNFPSPHQLPTLAALAAECGQEVLLLTHGKLPEYRRRLGWEAQIPAGVRVVAHAHAKSCKQKGVVDIVSGFGAGPSLSYLNQGPRSDRLFFMSEVPDSTTGYPGLLREMRARLFSRFAMNSAASLLAIGAESKRWHSKIGVPVERIFPWGYFVDDEPVGEGVPSLDTMNGSETVLCFIGRIERGKGLKPLVQSLAALRQKHHAELFYLQIIGRGTQEEELKSDVSTLGLKKVLFQGARSRSEVFAFLRNSDAMVLPSIAKEGWGVVINEALTVGTRVLCTNRCGASSLITSDMQGKVFDAATTGSLERELLALHEVRDRSRCNREALRKWAQRNIAPLRAAKYLHTIVSNRIYSAALVEPPWKVSPTNDACF